MPDINDKFVIYYAPKGYGSSLTVTISVYDTIGETEVNAQSMTELENTGIYYYNFYPKKRTSYTAIMDCVQRPYKAHQIIRIEKQKVSGAVTIPKIAFPPKTWQSKDKESVIKMINKISRTQLETKKQEIENLNELQLKDRNSHSELSNRMTELEKIQTLSKRNSQELIDKGIDSMKNSNTTFLEKQFDSLKKTFLTEVNNLSESTLTSKIKELNLKIIKFSKLADETNANIGLSNELFSSNLKNKLDKLTQQADDLILLLKNAEN